ncbi:GNAT family N-acetyltransferase [Paenibacillus chitinolyticus]|uniref:GNAT family N-acetyltransferase n=1 Tax=Paenibacillus chitinolyticus TaxID=79263 RepID=UPI002DB7B586|nr:GNAT family N-acetyltransferase [Paenibacillus chitinolyticus]MEC0247316.1 GNAT family N-acetyltransferase [Paenibacillus chitinolyticus]
MNVSYERPSPVEYAELRRFAGLSPLEEAAAAAGLNGSIFSVVVRDENSRLLGMGRIVGDGACYFQVADVLVHLSCRDQGTGIEDTLMKEIVLYLEKNTSEGSQVIVISDTPGIRLYQSFGFKLMYPDFYGMSRTSRQPV